MEVKAFGDIYRDRRVFVTGHTGFKGSWLVQWLDMLGAEVTGYAFAPETECSHWSLLQCRASDIRGDIRDQDALTRAVRAARPEIVFHLAAQPLVRRSYAQPLESWSTNVMGSANLLEACRQQDGLRAVVLVTTDKVYANQEWPWGYRESDPLGGIDPYSASKAASELVAASYRQAFYARSGGPLLATARAGNVIGGGDWSSDRLVPDLVRAMAGGEVLEIRSPRATRPWQHVLDCLAGYLRLGQRLLEGDALAAEAWNFGPAACDNRTVEAVLQLMRSHWPELRWKTSGDAHPHESTQLHLDSARARHSLGWEPVWGLEAAARETAIWYRRQEHDGGVVTCGQIGEFVSAARHAQVAWAQP